MARCSFSNVKALSTVVVDNLFPAISRRSFAAASSQGISMSNTTKVSGLSPNTNGNRESSSTDENASAWIPDPVTGYYRPANHAEEIDVADLREMLLSSSAKFNRST